LAASGRASVIVATAPSTSYRTVALIGASP
jgi:hypothetical protein